MRSVSVRILNLDNTVNNFKISRAIFNYKNFTKMEFIYQNKDGGKLCFFVRLLILLCIISPPDMMT